jgi:chitinase
MSLLLICDFVFVQFYNNPPCEIGSADFGASVAQWSAALETSTLPVKPRVYVGAPAWDTAGETAYTAIGSPMGMEIVAKAVKNFGLPNLGGVMFWDGPTGVDNLQDGTNTSIIDYAKLGLST